MLVATHAGLRGMLVATHAGLRGMLAAAHAGEGCSSRGDDFVATDLPAAVY